MSLLLAVLTPFLGAPLVAWAAPLSAQGTESSSVAIDAQVWTTVSTTVVAHDLAGMAATYHPAAVLVMMALASPFAYIHTRSGSVGVKVFSGIMLGIVFHMLNSLFSHLGLLHNWSPLFSALLPSAVFLSAALFMMWWTERR